jgi:hypothetical protein
MRLYIAVAVLTFAGSFAVYSGSSMLGAARAVGGSQSSIGGSEFLKSFNPFALLQTDRLRGLISSNAGVPRMEPFRSTFDSSDTSRGLRAPRIDPNIGRNAYIAPRAPAINMPPPIRFYR